MDHLILQETKYTPEIILNSNGTMSIKGKSYPENTFEFYKPIVEWIKNYFSTNAAPKTVVNMEILYFNSSSSKLFFDLFDIFDEARADHDIEINWIYHPENENALEMGEDFIEDFKSLKINLVEKPV